MKFILLAFIFIFSSCKGLNENKYAIAEMDLKISEEWIYAEKLLKLKSNDVELTRPPGFEQLVMELVIPQKGGLTYKTHCVYYLVPYKEKVSNFKIQELKDVDSCPDNSDKGITFFTLNGMSNLKVTFTDFKLTMNFQYNKIKQKIEIPMPNIEAGVAHEKYHALKEKRLMSGLKFLRLDDESFDNSTNRYLGKLSDRFSKGSAIRCHQVDKDCNTVGENRCVECRYGWYEVVDFQCAQGGSKFCGQNHCGEKNEPACPRGMKVVQLEETGICQSDLSPVVNGDKILVCQ
ncbi:MAG: hypothetical protein H7336_14465 [Bacteriovorax sp.]|nr:hypothetical protein [Bacteriovorax sp.]